MPAFDGGQERTGTVPGNGRTGGIRLSIVVPAYQEARRLAPSLASILEHLEGSAALLPAEILVVDDGSRDDTAAVARRFGAATTHRIQLVVLRHDCNRGKGAAVRTGFLASRGELVLLCDADLATPIEEVGVLAAASSPQRVVIGSRALRRDLIEAAQPRHRDLMGRVFNLMVRALALPGIRDSQCGFKLFPGPLGRALAAVQRLDGFAFDVELLMVARRWGVEVVEVPVRWRHVEESRVRLVRHPVQMLHDILTLWLRDLRGRAPRPPEGL